MRTFAVLLVALCAASMVCANKMRYPSTMNEDNSDYGDQPEPSMRMRTKIQSERGQYKDWHDTDTDTDTHTDTDTEAWNPDTTDVFPFRYKITKRLESSMKLSENPEEKEKLMDYFEEKVKICRVPSAGLNQVNKHCAGRLTGQMMLMIASSENDGTNGNSLRW